MFASIRHGWRVGALALLLAAAFISPAAVRPADAAEKMTRADVEELCLEQGGVYWEEYKDGKLVNFGCDFLDGDIWFCDNWSFQDYGFDSCWWSQASMAPSGNGYGDAIAGEPADSSASYAAEEDTYSMLVVEERQW